MKKTPRKVKVNRLVKINRLANENTRVKPNRSMNRDKKVRVIVIFLALVSSIYCIGILSATLYLGYYPKFSEKRGKEFTKNKEVLEKVATYLEKEEYSYIDINHMRYKDDIIALKNNERVELQFEALPIDIQKSMEVLFKKGKFNTITIEENGIYFKRWSNFDYGQGFVYSLDGKEPRNEFLINLRQLETKRWYHYEEE